MSSNYKHDEKRLKAILSKHVKPVDPENRIRLFIYYRNFKVRNLFIRNNPNCENKDYYVVYKWKCNQGQCNLTDTSYIGYTTNTVKERMRCHAQSGAINRHLKSKHNLKLTTDQLVKNTSILTHRTTKFELVIAESLLIRSEKPSLNIQDEGNSRKLLVF